MRDAGKAFKPLNIVVSRKISDGHYDLYQAAGALPNERTIIYIV